MKNLYLFVPNENVDNYIKYGIKLSQNANKVVTYERTEKKGIISYLSPMDSDKDFICNIKDYIYGNYEEPRALICSTILPENIFIYNKIIDTPLIIEKSKEFYYKHSVLDMLDNDLFTSFEVYQLLLILGQKKKLFKVKEVDEKLKLYDYLLGKYSNIDKKNGKKYTKKSNF